MGMGIRWGWDGDEDGDWDGMGWVREEWSWLRILPTHLPTYLRGNQLQHMHEDTQGAHLHFSPSRILIEISSLNSLPGKYVHEKDAEKRKIFSIYGFSFALFLPRSPLLRRER